LIRLKKVNPAIKVMAEVADIVAYQLRIIKNAKQTIRDIQDAGQFKDDEIDYLQNDF